LKDGYFWAILVGVILIPLLIISLFVACGLYVPPSSELFVGVDAAYDNIDEIKQFVNEACSYTNTIV
jgi:hypothetical protein